ncbi:MAG TPA: zf-HC2 domain-containing protein [Anaeromyxobacter sp.]
MTMSCRENELLLSLRAAGALGPDEAARLEGHLVLCAACRAEAEDLAAALDLAKLPPASEAERRVYGDLAERTLAELRRTARVRSLAKRIAVVFAAAAAAAAVVLAPAVLRRDARGPAGTEAAWQQPDLDALWSDASVVDLDSASAADGAYADPGQGEAQAQDEDDTDAVLAALEL